MNLTLNIYKGKEVEKTYTTDTYDIMFGTIESVVEIIDVNNLSNNLELGKMILKLLPQIKPLLKDIFDGVTDEEIKRTKVKELIPLFVEVFTYSLTELSSLGGNSKN